MKKIFLSFTILLTACNTNINVNETGVELNTSEFESDTSPTTTNSESVCGNLIKEPGEECDDNFEEINCKNCALPRKIFIKVDEKFAGSNISSKDLDMICSDSAMNAGISSSKTWKAWISKNGEDIAFNLYNSPGSYVSTNYTVIAHSFDDLIDGSINSSIILDQFSIQNYDVDVWTGLSELGKGMNNCNNWSDSRGDGIFGRSNTINKNWTNFGIEKCAHKKSIYCVEDEYIGE